MAGHDDSKSAPAATRGMPLRFKVPLFIFGGLLVVLGVRTTVSYLDIRDASLQVARNRLDALTREFARSYANATLGSTLAQSVTTPAYVEFARSGGTIGRDSMASRLNRAVRQSLNHRIEILSLDGTQLMGAQQDTTTGSDRLPERHEELEPQLERLRSGATRSAIGRLRLLDGRIVYPIMAAITADSQPVGVVVLWRRHSATPEQVEQVSALLGADAHLYIGNDRADVWSAFTRRVDAPPVPVPPTGELRRYARPDSDRVIASARAVDNVPWVVLIELSEAAMLAPATSYLESSITSGLFILLLATLVAWIASRRLTTPLHELSEAAGALASGDYSRAVPVRRNDEIGQLAVAFNTMAARVGEAHHALEDKVKERTAQLQERNEELEAFAHSISHDLRAPLRSMHGFSQALLEDNASQLDDTGKDYARRIAASAGRMDVLIQDLLAYSRISRAQVSLAPTDLRAVSLAAVSQLEADVAARQAVVTVHEPLPSVLAQRSVLEQIVANLVANALKFVAVGRRPEVHIRAEPVTGGRIRLWVEDNGIGIDNTHHQRIFSVFERLHSNEEYAGTGIGLAIVRKGAERLGGRAGVESTLGRGSRFWIELQHAET